MTKFQTRKACLLYWPALDIDLELESLEKPGLYPLRREKRGCWAQLT